MSRQDKAIRFIDSDYRELFRIPDGGSIKITYPPGDGRGTLTRACEYMDEAHTRIGGNVFHICEFAERMEALGARYEPEVQLQDAALLPFTPGEEKFFTYNREENNTCVGHISGDFGRQGDRFHQQWYNHKTKNEADWGKVSPEFQTELHSAVYALRQSVLKDRDTMLVFCQEHPEAKLPGEGGHEVYGFKLATDSRQYYVRCFAEHDAHFIAYAYDNAAPIQEQGRPAGDKEKASIIEQLQKGAPEPATDEKKRPKPQTPEL